MKPAPPSSTVSTIRYAMLAGIALFLAVAWYLRSSGAMPDADPGDTAALLGTMAGGLQLAALMAVFVVRRKLVEIEEGSGRFVLILVASGFCEAGALVGIVGHLLGGPITLGLSGLVIFGISMLWLPYEQ